MVRGGVLSYLGECDSEAFFVLALKVGALGKMHLAANGHGPCQVLQRRCRSAEHSNITLKEVLE